MTLSRSHFRRALALIFAVSAFLCLWRLDHALFWDDEAHISLVARNFVRTGVLSGWDGRNLIGYRNGSFLDAHFRTRNAPLDCLLAAASFAVLGPSTLAARLPFALFGLVSLLAFAYLVRREFRVRLVAVYALAYFALGVVFLLNARTCRYNGLALGFPIWAYAGYRYYLGTKKTWALVGCVLALVGLFYASFLFALAFGAALVSVALLYHRAQWTRRDRFAILGAGLLFLMATVPYIVRYQAWDYPRVFRDDFVTHVSTLLVWNLRDLGGIAPNIWPVALGAFFVARLSRGQSRTRQTEREETEAALLQERATRAAREWTALCLIYILVLCVLSPQPATITYIADTRYLLPIAPFLAGLVGWGLWRVHRAAPALSLATLTVALCFNIPFPAAYLPQASPFWRYSPTLLPAYVRENVLAYPTSTEAVLTYLRAHPLPKEKIAVSPSHMNLALMFYAGQQVQVCCQLGNPTMLPPEAALQLDDIQFAARTFPDRIIAFGKRKGSDNQLALSMLLGKFQRKHQQRGRIVRYAYQLEATLPIFWDETQRPELFLHAFGPVQQFEPDEAVFIYRRTLLPS